MSSTFSFEGKRKLFEGLAIEELEGDGPDAWAPHAVFHFDFSGGDYNREGGLEAKLDALLASWEDEYGIEAGGKALGDRRGGLWRLRATSQCIINALVHPRRRRCAMKMTSRLAALAIAVLLTAGIAPDIALAAGGTGLSTGKAALTTQTAVTVPSSGITAASSFYLGTGQKAKFTAVAGKAYMGSVSSKFSWNASYYGIFTVLKGGKTLATKKVGLSLGDADEHIWYESSFSYKPKVTGTYKVRFQFMDGSDEMESYEKTFKVKKASALKSCKPTFDVELGYVKKTDTQHPMLSGLNGKTQIYRATKKTGKFKLLATTSKTTYTDTKAKAGKEYWYKIRIVGKSGKKTYLSKLSAAKSEPLLYAPPKAPTITKTTSEDAGVVLEWKKTSSPFGCDYTVYRSEKESGGYEVVGRVREDYDGTLYAYDGGEISSESAFMDTTAEAGKTYYYKMSASYELKWNQKVATGAPVKVTT